MKKEALWTRNFIFVSVSNLFLFIAYYGLLVTLPSAVMKYLDASGAAAGLVNAVYLAAAIVIRPFLGPWIDRFGKRFILIASFSIFAACSVAYSFMHSIESLLVLRMIHGVSFGMATTITGTIIADVVPESRKGEGMGYFVMSTNLALVAGPFIGITIFRELDMDTLFWIGAFFSLAAFLLGLGTRMAKEEPGMAHAKQAPFEKRALPISITGGYFALAYSTVLSFMAVFASERDLSVESSFFFAVYALVLILSRPFTGRWYDQYGANWIIFPGIVLFGIGMFCLGMSHHAILFFTAAGLIGLGWGTLFSSFQTVAIQSVEPKRRSVATATFLSVFDIGIGGGSLFAGTLAGMMDLGAMYVAASVYIFLGLFVYHWAQKKKFHIQESIAREKNA